MTHLILVAHGKMALAAKASLEMIFGACPDVRCVSFLPSEGFDTVKEHIEAEIDRNSQNLIIADLFGGTPYNAACAVAIAREAGTTEVVSGLSLPLLLTAASQADGMGASELADELVEVGATATRKFEPSAIEDDDEL